MHGTRHVAASLLCMHACLALVPACLTMIPTCPFIRMCVRRLLYLERLRLEDASYMAVEPRLSDIRPVIYLARATLQNAQLIAWQIKNSRASK